MSVGGLDDRKLEEIVTRVVERLAPAAGANRIIPNESPGAACAPAPPIYVPRRSAGQGNRGLFDDVDHAVAAARERVLDLARGLAHCHQSAHGMRDWIARRRARSEDGPQREVV